MLKFFSQEKNYLTSLHNAKQIFTQKRRMQNGFIISESTIYKVLIFFFYLLSPIDIVPEKFVRPILFGFIDDLIIFVFMVSTIVVEVYDILDGLAYKKAENKEKEETIDAKKPESDLNKTEDENNPNLENID